MLPMLDICEQSPVATGAAHLVRPEGHTEAMPALPEGTTLVQILSQFVVSRQARKVSAPMHTVIAEPKGEASNRGARVAVSLYQRVR